MQTNAIMGATGQIGAAARSRIAHGAARMACRVRGKGVATSVKRGHGRAPALTTTISACLPAHQIVRGATARAAMLAGG